MPRTAPITRQVTLTGTRTHLGDILAEDSAVGVRITIPSDAASPVWIGDGTVTPSTGGLYRPGSSTRLPTTSFRDWYAITDGASVSAVLEAALGGNAGAPEWGDAGSAGGSGAGSPPTVVTGPGGEALATESTLAEIAGAVGTGQALADATRVAVSIGSSVPLTTQPAAGFAVENPEAGPGDGDAQRVVLGTTHLTKDVQEQSVVIPAIAAVQEGAWSVSLGQGDAGKPQYVQGTDGATPYDLAARSDAQATTAAVSSLESSLADHATTADVEAVRDRLPPALDGGRLAVESELSASGNLATEAKQDAAIDAVEAIQARKPLPSNSSTVPLAGGGAFTGSWESTLGYSVVHVSAFSDVHSAAHGLHIEQSSDGANVDFYNRFAGEPNEGAGHQVALVLPYVRVKYTNGADPQAVFRLYTSLLPTGVPLPTAPGPRGGLQIEAIKSPTWTVTAPAVTLALDKSLLSIAVAAGGPDKLLIRGIYLRNEQTSPIVGVIGSFDLFKITGHSGGTLLTPKAHDSEDVIHPSITVRTGATVAGEDSTYLRRVRLSTDEITPATLDLPGYQATQGAHVPIFGMPTAGGESIKPYTLNAGEGLHVKFTTNTSGLFEVVLVFTKEL